MNVLMVILYILLFVLCLSLLVIVHEAGHLAMAKIFKVYCLEYSIGFGPALFHKKRKNGETYFSIRGILFGGYVSMYGEGVALPEGVVVDSSRSLEGIKKWKRALILVAGVTMNAILALTLFFVSETAFPKMNFIAGTTIVESNSIAALAGIENEGDVKLEQFPEVLIIDRNAVAHYKDSSSEDVYAVLQRSIPSNTTLSWNDLIHFIRKDAVDIKDEGDESTWKFNITKELNIAEIYPSNTLLDYISFRVCVTEDNFKSINISTEGSGEEAKYQNIGISIKKEEYMQEFGDSVKNTFVDFGDASTAIGKGLASLFTSSEAWQGVGGMVAIGFETTNILKNFGVSSFIRVWGLISVNLAIINLIPFPGLDGWQLLVLGVEAIARKKIPEKAKNIVSFIGLALLFAFMIFIIFKDVFTYIF